LRARLQHGVRQVFHLFESLLLLLAHFAHCLHDLVRLINYVSFDKDLIISGVLFNLRLHEQHLHTCIFMSLHLEALLEMARGLRCLRLFFVKFLAQALHLVRQRHLLFALPLQVIHPLWQTTTSVTIAIHQVCRVA
jgi:hypothetical protein